MISGGMNATHKQESGFTLLEMAVVLVVIGVITAAASGMWRDWIDAPTAARTEAVLENLRSATLAFAAANQRLPCPDTNSDGREGDAAGACGVVTVGDVPYITLGFNASSSLYQNISYSVYRSANATLSLDADLAVVNERTGNVAGDVDFQNQGDFRQALSNASKAVATAAQVYVTGNGTGAGGVDCTNAAGLVMNVAFAMASAGSDDVDGDGNNYDGANAEPLGIGNAGRCFASSAQRRGRSYDDVVLVEVFPSILGAMGNAGR